MDQFLQLTKSELLASAPAEVQEEKTLGGKVLGSVSELFSRGQILDAEQRKAVGKRNDELATVAADTVAMLPGLRLSSAGLIRATALVRIDDDAVSLSTNFAKDFVEGAALHKIASMTLPEGQLGKAISAKLGKGLIADSASFALTGAAIASTSTGFKSETWYDASHNFSLAHGTGEILKAGTVGGVMGVPAGLLGKQIANFGLKLAQEGKISTTNALVLGGVGGGYLSGVAIGGAQGYLATGELKGAWYGAKDGGFTGAFTGGIGVFGIHALRANLTVPEISSKKDPSRQFLIDAPEAAKRDSLERSGHEQRVLPRALDIEQWKKLEISPEKLNDSDATLAERVNKLGAAFNGTAYYYQALPQAAEVAARSRSYHEFVELGGAHLVKDNMRMYNVNRAVVMLPEWYAAQLDEVLNLRLRAAQDGDFYQHGYGRARDVAEAQMQLEAHPLKDRAHPADFVQFLEELPDVNLVSEVLIRPDSSPDNAWKSVEHGYDFRAAATVSHEGRISFYAQDRSPYLRDYFKHEWSHLLKWKAESDSKRFDEAAKLEKDGYYVSKYARTNNDENWAEHAAAIMHPDPDKFLITAQEAPLRTFEIMRGIMKSFNAVDPSFRSIHQTELARRQAYVGNELMPVVKQTLFEHVQGTDAAKSKIAADLLGPIANDADMARLHGLAKTSSSDHVREAAFQASWNKLRETRFNVDGYIQRSIGSSRSQMTEFLVDQAQSGNRSRAAALEKLGKMDNASGQFYHDLLTLESYKGNKLSRVLKLLDDAPETSAQRAAWNEGMKIASNDANLRVDLALRALERHPQLTAEAVNILAIEGQERTRPFLKDLTEHYNARIARKAQEGLEKLDLAVRVADLKGRLKSDVEAERITAAGELAAMRNTKMVPVIVDAMLAAQSTAELNGIKKAVEPFIAQGILRFELRQRKASPGAGDWRMQNLTTNRGQ